jgi:hypothetical protein
VHQKLREIEKEPLAFTTSQLETQSIFSNQSL